MKKRLIVLCIVALLSVSFLSACSKKEPQKTQKEMKSVQHVGKVPEKFKSIVKSNDFKDVAAFKDRLLKAETVSEDEENRTETWQITMMDLYGKELADYILTCDEGYGVETFLATDDGGFLFVLNFSDYFYDDKWASEDGFVSRVIKCDKKGNLQFDTPVEKTGTLVDCCFQKNGKFYVFGDMEMPDTNTQGVYSPTDIYMAILDKNGKLLKSKCIAGSDYDDLDAAEISGKNFVLSIGSQSDDGDFKGSESGGHHVDWVITVNDALKIVKKEKKEGRGFSDFRIGEKNGKPIYMSDPIFDDFDGGMPTAYIDYGDNYLIISENETGEYENTPSFVSAIWTYSETVYSYYDKSGKLIFRTSVDSSPDYDAIVEKYENK